ncbi:MULTISPECIES: formylglycine-generating enzyme family protein [Okeania]|uniref:Formylglycine-generating enzyme family protein n=1 Tax=Okeania hirsuta TaxID=1458930 RepID=A0A3N6PKU1_9CYAN|nr:formylglycine-generating enzyme family protein [Okeania sp. SIO2B9]NET76850.1 formylglycine-generating enzyme family protein [Okeania sp. SIO1F9]RQH23344.1 formylglycine-generating enzyme family protein [Okeania hirsuta]RQH55427.1 formylglycine-generating enzyme family protein [Okeania hirsuta]
MSDSSFHRTIERLIDRLDQTGMLKRLELSNEDIADSIWLALQMGTVETQQKQEQKPEPEQLLPIKFEEGEPQESVTDREPIVSVITEESSFQTPEQPPVKGLSFQAPAAAALLNVLELGRALRPLMRKVPSITGKALDEEATVNLIAEQDVWLPVTKPEPERWLDLELVVEESSSAFIWRETVNELQQIFETQGAFRNVRVWSLLSSNSKLKLVRRDSSGKPRQREHSHRELIHPNQRGVVIFVSDCTSAVWQNATIHKWLKVWSEKSPTTVLQLFPEYLWDSTQLGAGRKLFGTTITPGVANPRLMLENLPAWIPIDWKNALVLPVILPEHELLKSWCRVVSGASNARVPTFLFDLKFVEEQYYDQPEQPESITELSTTTRVRQFLATTSITAQRLAGMMAAAPVNLSVVNLIRKNLLPEANPVHVAEVYMGGLLAATDSNGQEQIYEFFPGVRQELNQAMGRNETTAVLDAISRYIAEKIDRPIRSFRALLALLPQYEEEDREKVLPFAQVAVEVLENLGGEYAEFAREVAQNISGVSGSTMGETGEVTPEPQIEIDTFDVALIEVEKTVTFEFDVATLEKRRSGWLKLLGNRWVIKKQRRRVTGIVENLGDGIKLELVEIPAGKFIMGSNEFRRATFASPQHEVNVSAFLMGRYPITQAQWKAIVNNVPKIERDLDSNPSYFKGNNRPVETVSWYDAVEFCARLSKYTGRNYRLPSEAEWEYACRGGTTTPFHFGETITTGLANYDGNYSYGQGAKGKYRQETTPVGSFEVANAFGLYDMHGNVYEWCEDDWHENYKGAPNDGSAWRSGNQRTTKLLRGGCWRFKPLWCCSTSRHFHSPAVSSYYIGFRVLRVS